MSKSLTCFIIMPFDKRYLPVRDMIRKVVRSKNRGRAVRADDIFRPGNVIDQIKDAIQHADFCIADVTGNNPNVMWEVGYASALRKPVIAIRQHNEQLPFDVRQERFFNYQLKKLALVRPALTKAVESVIADLSSKPEFLGWRYDELTRLKQNLSRCFPTKGRDLLSILHEAIKNTDKLAWELDDEEHLMDCIARITGKIERTDCFWWLIVHGVFVYDQIYHFHVRGSDGYRDNLSLVKLSDRGVALLNLLSQKVRPPIHVINTDGRRPKTTEEEFFHKLEEHSPTEAEVARRILNWSEEHFDYVQWQRSSFVPVHECSGKSSHNPITIFGSTKIPRVQIKFGRMKRRNGFSDKSLLELLNRLNEIRGVNISKRQIDKYPAFPLSILAKDEALNKFFRTIKWTIESIKKSQRD